MSLNMFLVLLYEFLFVLLGNENICRDPNCSQKIYSVNTLWEHVSSCEKCQLKPDKIKALYLYSNIMFLLLCLMLLNTVV